MDATNLAAAQLSQLKALLSLQAHKGQESLEKKVALLEAHQKEVHDSLVSMENVALHMYQVGPTEAMYAKHCYIVTKRQIERWLSGMKLSSLSPAV